MSCRPDHSPRAPAFAAGNEAALTHGAYSSKRIGERANQILAEVLELAPHLDADEWRLAVTEYAMTRARVELLSVAIESHLRDSPVAKLSPRLVEAATTASREAAAQRNSLGLDPRGLAELRALDVKTRQIEAQLQSYAPAVVAALARVREHFGIDEAAWAEVFTGELAAVEKALDDGR